MVNRAISDEIGAIAGRNRVSMRELGRRIGRGSATMSRLRTGKVSWDVDDLVAVGRALDIPADELLRRALAELDECAPRESNPEPADSDWAPGPGQFVLLAA